MSASRMPTRKPRLRSATARLAVTVDLPTPPLPEAMAMTCAIPVVVLSRSGWGRLGVPSLTTTTTDAVRKYWPSKVSTCFLIFRAKGSRAFAKQSLTAIRLLLTEMFSTIPLETRSCPVSGWTMVARSFLIFSSILSDRFEERRPCRPICDAEIVRASTGAPPV